MSRKSQFIIITVLGLLIGIGCVFLLAFLELDYHALIIHGGEVLDYLAHTNPIVLMLCIGILPLVGAPVSPLVLAGGVVYGLWMGLLIALVGIALNNALSYWLAAHVLRRFMEGIAAKRNWKIPEIPESETSRIIIVFRLTPGLPLNVQNYILGLARIPFWKYFIYSFVVQIIAVSGFVITGGSIFEGDWGLVILGVSILICVGVIAKIAYNCYGKKLKLAEN